MKRILFLFISFYLSLLLADSVFLSEYNSYNYFSNFETQFEWKHSLPKDFVASFITQNTQSTNTFFDRSSKNANYNYAVSYEKYSFKPFVVYDYSSYYNSGLPQDSVSINDRKIDSGSIGYEATLLGDKLSIRQNANYLKLDNQFKQYYGFRTDTVVNYRYFDPKNTMISSIYYTNNDLFLDRNASSGAELNYLYRNNNDARLRLKYDLHEREIYTYHTLDDKSIRGEYLADFGVSYKITDKMRVKLDNRASYRQIDYRQKTRRDSWTLENDMNYLMNYIRDNAQYYARVNYITNERVYKSMMTQSQEQSTESSEKKLTYGAEWHFARIDTLRVEISNSLLQNFHSGNSKIMDNDRLINSYLIYTKNNIYNHELHNTFRFIQGEQVYINSSLSAYNHEKIGYLWNPLADLYLHENFRMINNYNVRVDYEYYKWKDFITDRVYRSFYGEWGIKYLSEDGKYSDSIIFYGAFALENYESAEKIIDQWHQNNNEYIRQCIMEIDYRKSYFMIKLRPVVKYFHDNIESEIQTDAAIRLSNLYIATSINPIGRQFNKMIWRFNLRMEYAF